MKFKSQDDKGLPKIKQLRAFLIRIIIVLKVESNKFILKNIFIGVQMLYNVVFLLYSKVIQLHIYIYISPLLGFPSHLGHQVEESSLRRAVDSQQLSISYIVVCIHVEESDTAQQLNNNDVRQPQSLSSSHPYACLGILHFFPASVALLLLCKI